MGQHEILANLQSLHTQLSSAGEIDEATRRMLETVTSDIQKLLENQSAASPSDGSVSESLRNTLIEFEVRHPHLGGLLERITNGLASIGI